VAAAVSLGPYLAFAGIFVLIVAGCWGIIRVFDDANEEAHSARRARRQESL
jgi:hypothetical protein